MEFFGFVSAFDEWTPNISLDGGQGLEMMRRKGKPFVRCLHEPGSRAVPKSWKRYTETEAVR